MPLECSFDSLCLFCHLFLFLVQLLLSAGSSINDVVSFFGLFLFYTPSPISISFYVSNSSVMIFAGSPWEAPNVSRKPPSFSQTLIIIWRSIISQFSTSQPLKNDDVINGQPACIWSSRCELWNSHVSNHFFNSSLYFSSSRKSEIMKKWNRTKNYIVKVGEQSFDSFN